VSGTRGKAGKPARAKASGPESFSKWQTNLAATTEVWAIPHASCLGQDSLPVCPSSAAESARAASESQPTILIGPLTSLVSRVKREA